MSHQVCTQFDPDTFLRLIAARTTVITTEVVAKVAPPMTTNVPAVAAPALRRGFMLAHVLHGRSIIATLCNTIAKH